MSSIETRQQSLLAVQSAIDGFLANTFGEGPTHHSSPAPTNSPALSRINPATVDISAELRAFGMNDTQTKAIATEFNRTLMPLTSHWSNCPVLPCDLSRTPDLTESYASAAQALYEADVAQLQRDFLAQLEVRMRTHRLDNDELAEHDDEDSDDESKYQSSEYGNDIAYEDEASLVEESEAGEQFSELERYYLILEKLYLSGVRHPTRELKAVMAAEWGVSLRSLSVWFQNRRDRKEDDIMAEIDFTTRLKLGAEDEGDWSDEGEVPWDALENLDEDDEVPDLPHIESGAAPYRIPSLSYSVVTESDSGSSRLPSPVCTFGTPSPQSKAEDLPPTRPVTPDVLSQTSSPFPVSASFSLATIQEHGHSSQPHSRNQYSFFPPDPSLSIEFVSTPTMNTDQNRLRNASQSPTEIHCITPPPETCESSGGDTSCSTQPSSISSFPTSPSFSFGFPFPSSPPLPSLKRSTSLAASSTRSTTPALSICSSFSAASSPAAGPTTPKAFSFSFGASMQPSHLISTPTIRENTKESSAETSKVTTFDFKFGAPFAVEPYDAALRHEEPATNPIVESDLSRLTEPAQSITTPTIDEGISSGMEGPASEAGRIIFFPSADDALEDQRFPTMLEHPGLNRPLSSFEDAVQLHFLATAAALVDEREPVRARQDAMEAIDAATVPLPVSPSLRATCGQDAVDDKEPLMEALPPRPAISDVGEMKVLELVLPGDMPLQSSLTKPLIPTTAPLAHPRGPVARPLSPYIRHIEPTARSPPIPEEDSLPGLPTALTKFSTLPDVTSNSPENVSLPPSPGLLTLSENAVTSIEPLYLSSDPVSVTANSPHSSLCSSTENSETIPITFPSTAHFLDFKPIVLQSLSIEATPSLDLSWSHDSRTPSKERGLSPFEEFMPSTINFQPPPPKLNSELQDVLETFFLNWGGLKPIT